MNAANDAATRRCPWRTLLLLAILALLLRAPFLLISDNADGDAYARMKLARQVVSEAQWVPTQVWLPVHFWLLSIPCWMGLTSQLWLRFATLLAGVFTVPSVYLLVKECYGHRSALTASVLLALNPLHIRLSIITVSEAFFLLCGTLALWGFVIYLENGSMVALLAGSLAMNAACGHRFEAWLMLPALPVAGWLEKAETPSHRSRRLSRSILFMLLSSIFALCWAAYQWSNFGDPFHTASLTQQTNLADPTFQKSSFLYEIAFWPAVLFVAVGPATLMQSSRSVIRVVRKGPHRFFGWLFLGFLAIFYVQNFRSAMITQARYGILLIWLLLLAGCVPSDRDWTTQFKGLVGISCIWMILVWGVAEMDLGLISEKFRSVSPRPSFDREVHEVDRYLRDKTRSGPLLIGPLEEAYGPWMSTLDEWFPMDEVQVVHSPEELAEYALGNRSGYWIADQKWLADHAWNLSGSVVGDRLRHRLVAGRYEVYSW
jgi:4-amino-4-deoxy-L-arabinose transferase-like glycosyltransferase